MPDAALVALAQKAAAAFGVPESLFIAQIQQESSFNPNAQNGPASGIAQFMPATAAQYGVTNPYDPAQALWGAAAYDAALYKQTGSWSSVLQSYGTVPSSGTLTTGQQSVASIATSLDQSGTGAGAATGAVTPVAFPIPGAQTLANIGGAIGDFFIRAAIILVGVIIIWQGLAMMRGSNVKENITVVVKGARNRAAKAASEAA